MAARSHAKNGSGEWRFLHDHLKTVAAAAAERLPNIQPLAYYTGLWHDLGKYHQDWQQRLEAVADNRADRIAIPHSRPGAVWALRHCWPLAFPILGHHGEIPNKTELLKLKGPEQQLTCDVAVFQARADFHQGLLPTEALLEGCPRSQLAIDLTIRMLFSALVDADCIDAAKHFGHWQAANIPSLEELDRRLQDSEPPLSQGVPPAAIAEMSTEIYRFCKQKGAIAAGFFCLNAPAGLGKWRNEIAFGLNHCLTHGKQRVIYTAPFMASLESAAQVYRNLLGEDAVLEHHSSFDFDPLEDDRSLDRYGLDGLQWQHPMVVTSPRQLFESLLSNKAYKCRKLHQIANNVIIIDEVHSLPISYLNPIADILKALVRDWDCTVLFGSSSLNPVGWLRRLFDIDCQEIVPGETRSRYFTQMKQSVTYRYQGERLWQWADIANDIQEQAVRFVLITVNSSVDAQIGFDVLQQRFDPNHCFHLSTHMYPHHRKQTLTLVRQRLENQQPTYLVATHLIEAGLDLEFAAHYRALAPLDRHIQATGRMNCSRNPPAVQTIFRLRRGKSPAGDYRERVNLAQQELEQGLDLTRIEDCDRYFDQLLEKIERDSQHIQRKRQRLQFRAVAEAIEFIEEDGRLTVVVGTPEALALLDKPYLTQSDYQQLQDYTVHLPRRLARQSELRKGIFVWSMENYSEVFGIVG